MKRTHSGFTLVELLVVITIIGILMGLLIPAVNAARESARRAQCNTQIKNLALAAVQHENTKGALPGYMNKYGAYVGDGAGGPGDDPSDPGVIADVPPHVKIGAWGVSLLPWLDAQPTYEHWTQDRYPILYVSRTPSEYSGTANPSFEGTGYHELAAPNLAIFQCPSNPITDAQYGRNSYIVSTGPALFRTTAADTPDGPTAPPAGLATSPAVTAAMFVTGNRRAQAPFTNQYQGLSTVNILGDQVRLDDFKDGQGNTMLFSENVQALPWFRAGYLDPTDMAPAAGPPINYEVAYDPTSTTAPTLGARYTNGMVWHYEDKDSSAMPADPITGIACRPVYVKHRINGGGQAAGQDIFTLQMSEASANFVDLARPSSAHVGGVNAGMADGGTRFIQETVDYRVYQALMTLRGKSSTVPFTEYVLSDESLN